MADASSDTVEESSGAVVCVSRFVLGKLAATGASGISFPKSPSLSGRYTYASGSSARLVVWGFDRTVLKEIVALSHDDYTTL